MLDWLTTGTAWAMGIGQKGTEGGESAGGLGGLLSGPIPMLVLMFVIFYFLLIRPQQKKAKVHKAMLANIRKGDKVLTNGGIYGRVTGLDEQTMTVEIAPQVRIKVSRGHVAGVVGAATTPTAPETKK
ncbi:MAG: preprotein translocase subunit YajC [Proteobacteria bacterium]|nr:preprotein translocase subunit YajC [Pseudomonadota bacterium]